ncbi:hypothetical protein FGG08_007164 [Glutinoglossum americanum]|uniref:DUF7918 domain-containing protein n=1 Tax=Glutinoglossum americanum TaxID=1670608 RepID=A0A9P8KWQ7_9PEZI|nr:hypothetical protein FGG08_007164 [Glutinoglossum americanum]
MAIINGLEVVIVSNGKNLKEYDNPDGDDHGDDSGLAQKVEKFIEASNGAKFAIQCTIKPSFPLYGADGVSVGFYTDGQYINGRSVSVDLLRTRGWTGTASNMVYFCHERNTWMDAELSFGDLRTVEGGASEQSSSCLIKSLGVIKVTISRGAKKEGGRFKPPKGDIIGSEVSEKAVKGRAITNRVTSPSPMPIERREPIKLPIGATDGREDASREELLKAEEIRRLRERLVELEGGSGAIMGEAKVKNEPSSSGPRVKRERAGQDASATPRQKRSKVIEVVDLTDD